VRQVLSAIELLAHTQGGTRTLTGVAHSALDAARLPFRHLDPFRDKESNLDLRIQSAASYRLDDLGACTSVQPILGSTQVHRLGLRCRSSALIPSLLCPCHSPTLRPWIAGCGCARPRDDVVVEGLWSPSLARSPKMRMQKQTPMHVCNFQRRAPRSLSLSGGASIRSGASQAEHHLSGS
jgi:hypothetical protein